MKSAAVALCALMCVVGLACAQFGFGDFGAPAPSSGGLGGGVVMLLLVVVLLSLFSGRTGTSGGTTTFIHGNFSAPTGK